MAPNWIEAARVRYNNASIKYEEWKQKEVQGTIDFLSARKRAKDDDKMTALEYEQYIDGRNRQRRGRRARDPDRQLMRGVFNPTVERWFGVTNPNTGEHAWRLQEYIDDLSE